MALAALLAPADVRADVKRPVFIPSITGVSEFRIGVGVQPGYTSVIPSTLAFSSDGQKMYGVTSVGDLLVYDLNTNNAPTSHSLMLTDTVSMVASRDGTKLYLARGTSLVTVVTLSTWAVNDISAVSVGPLALSPDGTTLYVAGVSQLRKYSTADDSYIDQVASNVRPNGLAITPDGQRAVIAGDNSGLSQFEVEIFDLQTFTKEGSSVVIPTGANVAVTMDSQYAIIPDGGADVRYIDLDTRAVQLADRNGFTPGGLRAIDVDESGRLALLYSVGDQKLYFIDLTIWKITASTAFAGLEMNGKFVGRPIFIAGGSSTVVDDPDLTTLGFGPEVLVNGPVAFDGGFSSSRTFRFIGYPDISVSGAGTATFDGSVRGTGFTVTSDNAGTLRMTGTTTLPQGVLVTAATLQMDGSHTGPVIVESNGFLTGTGTIDSYVNVEPGGTVRPAGAGVGILTVTGNVGFEEGSSFSLDINGATAGTGYDRLDAGSTMVKPNVTLQTLLGYTPSPGDQFRVLTNLDGASSPFAGTSGSNGAGYAIGAFNTLVRYDGGSGSDMTLTVDALPATSVIANANIGEDTVYNGSFTISDDQTPVSSLSVTVTSSNHTLVPDANISFDPTGATRAIQITPVAERSGITTITVRVADANFYSDRTFQLTVDSVNDAPTMTAIGPQTTAEDTPKGPIAFDVDDIDGCIFAVTIVGTSSNQAIVPDANIVSSGTGVHRTLTITPAANAYGTVTITLRAYDDDDFSEQTFQFTVTPTPDPPSISPIANQTIEQDATSGSIAITIADVDGFGDHIVTATSGYEPLVPNANLVIGGTGGARTLTITPLAGQHGTSIITVWVNDDTGQTSASFMLTVNEATAPAAITYALAEGATGTFFDTDLLLANPNAVPAPVTITWMLEGGGTISDSRVLAPTSRTTIKVDEVAGLESTTFSTQVVSTEGHAIAVERTMRWGAGGYGAHTEKAGDAGATTWYFAEGASGWFSTYLLLGNSQGTANTAHVEWLREGEPVLMRDYPLLPHSRTTIDTREDAELRDRSFGAKVTFDQPGVAERTMYFGGSPLWSGGGAAAGQTSLATRWDFAEGATGTYFTTFLLLANPGTTPATVTLTYFPQGGTPVTITDTLAAGQRMTRNIAFEHPSLADASMASRVESTQPIVAERAQYWGAPEWIESHNSFGVTTPGKRWALAEGRVGGDDSAQTYILLSNPGTTAGTATLTFLRTDGTTVVKSIEVPAASRVTFGVTGPDGAAPELVNEAFGTRIASTQPIIVERSFYTNANGVIWAAGTNATATALPEPQ